jgi:hypothetical protein
MTHGSEALSDAAADALRGRIDADEVGMIALEILQLAQQRIIFGVGDFRRGLDVITFFVMADELAELFDASGRIHRCA